MSSRYHPQRSRTHIKSLINSIAHRQAAPSRYQPHPYTGITLKPGQKPLKHTNLQLHSSRRNRPKDIRDLPILSFFQKESARHSKIRNQFKQRMWKNVWKREADTPEEWKKLVLACNSPD